jgi:hypothetical protein
MWRGGTHAYPSSRQHPDHRRRFVRGSSRRTEIGVRQLARDGLEMSRQLRDHQRRGEFVAGTRRHISRHARPIRRALLRASALCGGVLASVRDIRRRPPPRPRHRRRLSDGGGGVVSFPTRSGERSSMAGPRRLPHRQESTPSPHGLGGRFLRARSTMNASHLTPPPGPLCPFRKGSTVVARIGAAPIS